MSAHNLPSINQKRGYASQSTLRPSAQQYESTSKLQSDTNQNSSYTSLQSPYRSDSSLMRLRVSNSTPLASPTSPQTVKSPNSEDANDSTPSSPRYQYPKNGDRQSDLQSVAQPTVASLMKLLASTSHIQSLPNVDRTSIIAKQQRQRLQRSRDAKLRRTLEATGGDQHPDASPVPSDNDGSRQPTRATDMYASSYLTYLPAPQHEDRHAHDSTARAAHRGESLHRPHEQGHRADNANAQARGGHRSRTQHMPHLYAHRHGGYASQPPAEHHSSPTAHDTATHNASHAQTQTSSTSGKPLSEKDRLRAERQREREVRRRVHQFFSATAIYESHGTHRGKQRAWSSGNGAGASGDTRVSRGADAANSRDGARVADVADRKAVERHGKKLPLPAHSLVLMRTGNDYATNTHQYVIASSGGQAHRTNTPASLATVALRDVDEHPNDWSRMNLKTMRAFGVGPVGKTDDYPEPKVILRKDMARWVRQMAEGKTLGKCKGGKGVWLKEIPVEKTDEEGRAKSAKDEETKAEASENATGGDNAEGGNAEPTEPTTSASENPKNSSNGKEKDSVPRVRVVGCSRAHAHALVYDKHVKKREDFLSRLALGANKDKMATMRGIQVELWGKERFTFTAGSAEAAGAEGATAESGNDAGAAKEAAVESEEQAV